MYRWCRVGSQCQRDMSITTTYLLHGTGYDTEWKSMADSIWHTHCTYIQKYIPVDIKYHSLKSSYKCKMMKNSNPALHTLWTVTWNHLSIPKLQRLHQWCLGTDKLFHCTLSWTCENLTMLGLILTHVSKRPCYLWFSSIVCQRYFIEMMPYCVWIVLNA